MFDTYIIVSPALWWGGESLLDESSSQSKVFNSTLRVYIGASNQSEDTIMYNDARHLSSLLKKYWSGNLKVYYDYLPDETHATILHHAVYNAFKLLYPKK